MKRFLAIFGTVFLTSALLYFSRFWFWHAPWGGEGLFAIKALSPDGDIVRRLLRGTPADIFDLVIWIGLVFAGLSILQWLHDRIRGD